ncbi:GAF domain-containing protein [Sphingomonas sp. NCPPB 2930]
MKRNVFEFDDMDQLDVTVSDMLLATADQSDAMVDASVTEVLQVLRERLGMDVVFVAEFDGDRHVVRQVANPAQEQAHVPGEVRELEQTWCHYVVEGRLPRLVRDTRTEPAVRAAPPPPGRVGAFITTPILLEGRKNYGTLCTYSFAANEALGERQLQAMEKAAQHISRAVSRGRRG